MTSPYEFGVQLAIKEASLGKALSTAASKAKDVWGRAGYLGGAGIGAGVGGVGNTLLGGDFSTGAMYGAGAGLGAKLLSRLRQPPRGPIPGQKLLPPGKPPGDWLDGTTIKRSGAY